MTLKTHAGMVAGETDQGDGSLQATRPMKQRCR